jgi:hypothetical protein
MKNFLRGHLSAFAACNEILRVISYGNLRRAVLERQGKAIRFGSDLLQFVAYLRTASRRRRPQRPMRRMDKAIRFVRDAFFAVRTFAISRSSADLSAQTDTWYGGLAADRRCPEDQTHSGGEIVAVDASLPLKQPGNAYPVVERVAVKVGKTLYVRFDQNDYTVVSVASDPHSNDGGSYAAFG